MQVKYVHTLRLQLFQGEGKLLFDNSSLVSPRLFRITFRGQSQASFFPVGFCGERFLLACLQVSQVLRFSLRRIFTGSNLPPIYDRAVSTSL